jgi:hypothetical protein
MKGLTDGERNILSRGTLGFCSDEEWEIAETLGARGLMTYRDDGVGVDYYDTSQLGELALQCDTLARMLR